MAKHVAVDVHKTTLFAVGVDPETGEELFRRRFPASEAGEAALLERLEPGDCVVLEATRGAYRLANRLECSGATVLVIDPQKAALVGFRGKKSDYRDCLALLEHLRSNTITVVWRPEPNTRLVRLLTRERSAYNHTITRLKNRLHALLHEFGLRSPGALLWTREGYDWLQQVAVPAEVRAMLLREWGLLLSVLEQKQSLEAQIQAHALPRPEVPRLMQVCGFGAATALMVLGEIGTISRFPNSKKLVSYAGLDSRVHHSGDKRYTGSITKAGRSQLRWLLVEVAWTHVNHHGPEAHHFHALVSRGKKPGVAIVALARRLLVLAYHLLKKEEAYRGLNPEQYHGKLCKLAAWRPAHAARPPEERRHVDWADARYQEVVGVPPGFRQGPPGNRRPRAPRRRGGEPQPNPVAAKESLGQPSSENSAGGAGVLTAAV